MNMSEARMTVIMSCYNQAKYLRQAVESVFAQKTGFPVRLVITDDNSTKDNSRELIKELAEKNPDRVTALLNGENGRYLKNILRAKAITKTEYFTLLDADDYWTDADYLQKAVSFLDANPSFAIYSCNTLCMEEDGKTRPFVSASRPNADFSFQDYLHDRVTITQTGATVFRNVIFVHGIPDMMQTASGTDSERTFEGDVMRYVMHLDRGKAHFVNEISGVYRILGGSLWASVPQSEKYAIGARNCFVYDSYFERRYHEFFMLKSFGEFRKALHSIREEILEGTYVRSANRDRLLGDVSERFSREGLKELFRSWKPGLADKVKVRLERKLAKDLSRNPYWLPKGGV